MMFERPAVVTDVEALAAMNRAAYPDLVGDGVVYDEAQLREQILRYPRGQWVVTDGATLVGAISTLVVPERSALGRHTWMGITDCGRFGTHREEADTLYLADIYVAPHAQGRGVGGMLYRRLRRLALEQRRRRIVAGGRLWGYADHADRLTPEAYVAEVVRGSLRDRVLDSQLRAGFRVRAILPNYLDDWRSRGFATLLDWPNPEVLATSTRRVRDATA